MIIRYHANCNGCGEKFVLRAVIPNAENSLFSFPCPACKIRLKGQFKLKSEPQNVEIASQNFSLEQVKNAIPSSVITVSTEIPVHKLNHEKKLTEGGSPFLWLAQNMGSGFCEWLQTVKLLHDLNNRHSELLQNLVNYASIDNWDKIQDILSESWDKDIKTADTHQAIYGLHRILSSFYAPLIKQDEMVEILEEYYFYLNDCIKNHKADYINMLESYYSSYGFSMFKRQVYETYYRAPRLIEKAVSV